MLILNSHFCNLTDIPATDDLKKSHDNYLESHLKFINGPWFSFADFLYGPNLQKTKRTHEVRS